MAWLDRRVWVWEEFDGFEGMERCMGRTDSLLYEQ